MPSPTDGSRGHRGQEINRHCRRAARQKAEPYVVWDAVQIGLGIKVTPRGKRIWVEQLRYPGYRCQSTRTLGHYPAMSLAQARTKAGQWVRVGESGRRSGAS
jgi:hypothetical protein